MKKSILLVILMTVISSLPAVAQQKIGYVDSEFILQNIPDYATVQQNLDRQAQEWNNEMKKMENEVEESFREYQARELLYTAEEKTKSQDRIMLLETELEQYRLRYFGPEGQLFKDQQNQMKPIQEKILTAIEEVATEGGYDFVLDKSGDVLFLFTRDQYDLSLDVLDELGIDTESLRGNTPGGSAR